MRTGGRGVLLAALVLVACGCVGTVSRADLEAEVRARGGGLDEALLVEAVQEVAAVTGTDDLRIVRLVAHPSARTVSLRVRDPNRPDLLDDYTVRDGQLERVEPVRVPAGTDLEAETFALASFRLDRIEAMVDDSLARWDSPEGYVASLQFLAVPAPGAPTPTPVVRLELESPRSSAVATLSPGGEPISLEPT